MKHLILIVVISVFASLVFNIFLAYKLDEAKILIERQKTEIEDMKLCTLTSVVCDYEK